MPCDETDKDLFATATEITIGDGAIANFWKDRWLQGLAPRELAPSLYAAAKRKDRRVREALQDQRWLLDLSHGLSEEMLPELLNLARLLDDVQLNDGTPDSIRWRLEASGEYSARSAYLAQFAGATATDHTATIWKCWAPGKCKFFMWMATLNRILTADALQRRGWENNYFCALCNRSLETPLHLMVDCPWSRKVWSALAAGAHTDALKPESWEDPSTISEWLLLCRIRSPTEKRKGIQSLILLAAWEIWLERNRRIFQREELSVDLLVRRIRDEAVLWNVAGAVIPFDPG